MSEDAPLELRPGCIHQAWDRAFTCLAKVWPSTTPGYWWVVLNADPIGELTPGAEVPAVLALANFHAEAWTVWRVEPQAQNPSTRRPSLP